MRLKNTLVWSLILFVLFAFVYFYEIKGQGQRDKTLEDANKVFLFPPPQIKSLELKNKGQTIRCVKSKKNKWSILQPIKSRADKNVIDLLLDTLARTTIERKLEATGKKDLSAFGLDKPGLSIKLTDQDNKEYSLQLGASNPIGNRIYAKSGQNEQILLLNSGLRYSLDKSLFDFRDKRVFNIPEADVSKISLKTPKETIILDNNTQTGWQIISPKKLKAGTEEVGLLLANIGSWRVKKFVDEDTDNPAKFGLDKPVFKLSVKSVKKESPDILLLSNRKQVDEDKMVVYARYAALPEIMLLDSKILSDIDKSVFDLRERRILRFDTVRVNELELENSAWDIKFKKLSGNWRMTKPERTPAKGYMLESMLYELSRLKAKAFIEAEDKNTAYGWDKPQVKVSLTGQQANKSFSLNLTFGAFNKKDDSLIYVRRGDGKIFLVSKDILPAIILTPADLKLQEAKK